MAINLCISGFGRLGMEVGCKSVFNICAVDLNDRELPGVKFYLPKDIEKALAKSEILFISHNNPNEVATQAEVAAKNDVPIIVATTGLSHSNISYLKSISDRVPVIIADNFSLGVALFARQVREAAKILPADWSVEIIEYHHEGKLDCPSGTAIKLAKQICLARDLDSEKFVKTGRSKGRLNRPRQRQEIFIHSARAGTVFGKHVVLFFGPNEVCTYEHEALSRGIFADGAVCAIKWIINGQEPGIYGMDDVYGLRERDSNAK